MTTANAIEDDGINPIPTIALGDQAIPTALGIRAIREVLIGQKDPDPIDRGGLIVMVAAVTAEILMDEEAAEEAIATDQDRTETGEMEDSVEGKASDADVNVPADRFLRIVQTT